MNHVDALCGLRIDKRGARRERGNLCEKVSGAEHQDRRNLAKPVVLVKRELASQNDEHTGAGRTGGNQTLTLIETAFATEASNAPDIAFVELRKKQGLLAVPRDIGLQACYGIGACHTLRPFLIRPPRP